MFHQDVGPESGSDMSTGLDTVEEEEGELDFPLQAAIKSGDLMSPMESSLRGDSGRCFATTSPRSQAVGFPKATSPLHIG